MNRITYSLLLPIIVLLSSLGCHNQAHRAYGYEINAYRQMIGLQKNQLDNIFGRSNIVPAKLPMHDPETHENSLVVLVGQQPIYFKIKDDIVVRAIFRSPKFKTDKNVFVGRKFCDVLFAYPDATFYFGYRDGGFVRLIDKNEGVLFEFSTAELPFNQFVEEGPPNKNSSLLCIALLDSIELFDPEIWLGR